MIRACNKSFVIPEKKYWVMEQSRAQVATSTNSDLPNSPVSALSDGFRNRKSFEAHPASFTPSSSVYSGSVSQTSSALGRLIEYVDYPTITVIPS